MRKAAFLFSLFSLISTFHGQNEAKRTKCFESKARRLKSELKRRKKKRVKWREEKRREEKKEMLSVRFSYLFGSKFTCLIVWLQAQLLYLSYCMFGIGIRSLCSHSYSYSLLRCCCCCCCCWKARKPRTMQVPTNSHFVLPTFKHSFLLSNRLNSATNLAFCRNCVTS